MKSLTAPKVVRADALDLARRRCVAGPRGAFVSGGQILFRHLRARHRLKMPIMEAVEPVTALHFGPLAICGYYRFGRTTSAHWLMEHDLDRPPDKPGWAPSPSGSATAEPGAPPGRHHRRVRRVRPRCHRRRDRTALRLPRDYLMAVLLGVIFQYFAIAPLRSLGVRDGLKAAVQADVLPLTAFRGRPVQVDGVDDVRVLPCH